MQESNFEGAYLDAAATMQPYPEVVEVVARTLREVWGNPSSSHRLGAEAKAVLESSRTTIAEALGVAPDELFFTSGGTEANNLAVTGSCLAHIGRGRGVDGGTAPVSRRPRSKAQELSPRLRGSTIITSELEHPSVTKAVRSLKRTGWPVEYLAAAAGQLDLGHLETVLRDLADGFGTGSLITIMYVQNELGYLFPLKAVAELRDRLAPQALFHSDAVQAFGKLPFRPHQIGLDLASINAHKIGGPKGVGALFVKAGCELFSTALGGGQERGLRSGTEAVALAAGFAKAVEISMAGQDAAYRRAVALKGQLAQLICQHFKAATVNSRDDGSPFILSFSLPGIDNEQAMAKLSAAGIYLSRASACTSNHSTVPPGTWREKHPLVLQLAGLPKSALRNTFRVSFSTLSSQQDIERLVEALLALRD
ncbi:MAG: cysteine desulfurase [Actinomycetia bacterium]|nr:cysteine desulfurase [Actinomycetes bacterium]